MKPQVMRAISRLFLRGFLAEKGETNEKALQVTGRVQSIPS